MKIHPADRSSGVGGSEIAAILGISPFQSAWEVYARKKGLLEPQPETERMKWGKYLQKAIAQVFTARTELPHRWCDRQIAHRRRKWQFASPDALVLTQPKQILEIKNVGLDQAGQWDREVSSEDGVPEYYACQGAWLMSTLELEVCWIAALIGGNEFRVYKATRDAEIEAVLLEEGWNFVHNHLDANVPPPIDGSRAAADYLRKRFPREKEKIRQALGAEVQMLDEYAALRTAQESLQARREELENQLKEAVGESEGLLWPHGKFTWKKSKDRTETDWEALARAQIKDFTKEEQAAFLEQYTNVKHGTRRIYLRSDHMPESIPSVPATPILVPDDAIQRDGGEQFGETPQENAHA